MLLNLTDKNCNLLDDSLNLLISQTRLLECFQETILILAKTRESYLIHFDFNHGLDAGFPKAVNRFTGQNRLPKFHS